MLARTQLLIPFYGIKKRISEVWLFVNKLYKSTFLQFYVKVYLYMVITHHGGQCFKITFGDLTLVFDPIAKNSSLPAVRFGADIVLVSRNHKDTNGVEEVTYGEKKPFVIDGPGEYERFGITAQGFLTKSSYGLTDGQNDAVNIVYIVEIDNIKLVHLGALSEKELPVNAREVFNGIDILFVPIGGDGVLDASEAHKLSVLLEPRITIPMHWNGIGAPKALEQFIKEEDGAVEKVNKLTLKKKDVLEKDGAIIVITP